MYSMGDSLFMALTAVRAIIVEQLGLLIMPLCFNASSGFISGTTRGTSGSILKALELSTNTAPAALIAGAKRLAMSFSAAPSTMSAPSKAVSQASPSSAFPNGVSILPPALRSLLSSLSPPIGNLRSQSTLIICSPTAPVAPNIATLYLFMYSLSFRSIKFDNGPRSIFPRWDSPASPP